MSGMEIVQRRGENAGLRIENPGSRPVWATNQLSEFHHTVARLGAFISSLTRVKFSSVVSSSLNTL